MDPVEIGNNIKKQRKTKKLTQQELAERIGRTESSVRKYEKGLVQIPIDVLDQIASILEVSPIELMGFEYFDMKESENPLTGLKELESLENYIVALGYEIKPASEGAISGISQEESERLAMEEDEDPNFPTWEVTTKEGNTFIVSLAEHKQLIRRVKSLIASELKIIEENGYYTKERKKDPWCCSTKDLSCNH